MPRLYFSPTRFEVNERATTLRVKLARDGQEGRVLPPGRVARRMARPRGSSGFLVRSAPHSGHFTDSSINSG
jgi:hypothetical protein